MEATTTQKLLAEALGTALLLAVVIGSGIMAQRLSGGNAAIALLANALATVGGLYVLIEVFGPVSGAHFNPAVSLVMAYRKAMPVGLLAPYILVQLPSLRFVSRRPRREGLRYPPRLAFEQQELH